MRKFILFIYCITIPALTYSQVQNYTPKVKFAIETYAFLKGQSTALEMVALQFPKLKPDVTAVAKKTVLFERAQRNIENFLKDELSDSDFNVIENRINFLLKEQFKNPIEEEKYARDFLEKVKERSHFRGDTLLAKGIISFAYQDAPHQEITDGHVETYTTKGNPKAEQETVKIPVPKSWLAEEAEMPETVQQFTSHFGNGNEKMLLVIYDLPEENFILNAKSITEMIPPQTKLIRTEILKIDENPAIMVEVEETVNQDKTKIRMLQFMFTQKQKLYCLQGSIGPVEIKKNLEPEIKKYEPLFRLIAEGTQID
ncbi:MULTISPECIES: hypothetical protein [unclassified Flavobacterium]|uniref:hypothetical protein n=1 Tax=unclassified Flavobacterium TaxID=196869 RepID=UPI0010605BCA|nr:MULTISPECIES: hypothetical protein [unclassified Flavobacterium]TDP00240.1 hypothetical protein EV145_106129 [Flavobacterium sp. 245]TDW52153.1 hypothetical protein EV144_101837 [Flavobacterium sp. 270]